MPLAIAATQPRLSLVVLGLLSSLVMIASSACSDSEDSTSDDDAGASSSSSSGRSGSSGNGSSGNGSSGNGSSSSGGSSSSSSSSGGSGSSSGSSSGGTIETASLEVSPTVGGQARELLTIGPGTIAPMQVDSEAWAEQPCVVGSSSEAWAYRYVELTNSSGTGVRVDVRVDSNPAQTGYRDTVVAAYANLPANDTERAQCLTGLNDTCRNLNFGDGNSMNTAGWGCLASGLDYDMRPIVPAGGSIWVFVGALDDGADLLSRTDFRITVTTRDIVPQP